MTRFLVLLAVALVAQAPASDPGADARAVYRSALQLRFTADAAPLTQITLLQQTRAVLPPVCALEEHAPADWRPVVESYKKENAVAQTLPADIDVGVPRALITLEALKSRMRAAGYNLARESGWQTPGTEIFARLAGGQLVVLSAVGFNQARTRAMLTVQSNCFPSELPDAQHTPCHEGRQLLMEKANGQWTAVNDRELTCLWVP